MINVQITINVADIGTCEWLCWIQGMVSVFGDFVISMMYLFLILILWVWCVCMYMEHIEYNCCIYANKKNVSMC